MTNARDPLVGAERLLVDGNNLLHAMRRGPAGPGGPGPMPAAALVGRLRATIPPQIRIEIVFDGPPDPGSGKVRVASGVVVRYAGRITADQLLVRLVGEAAPRTIAEALGILVVTDDLALGAELRRLGARTARTSWLIGRLARVTAASPTSGPARPPVRPASSDEVDRDADAAADRWRPGRGATAKRGNPRRSPRRAPRP